MLAFANLLLRDLPKCAPKDALVLKHIKTPSVLGSLINALRAIKGYLGAFCLLLHFEVNNFLTFTSPSNSLFFLREQLKPREKMYRLLSPINAKYAY